MARNNSRLSNISIIVWIERSSILIFAGIIYLTGQFLSGTWFQNSFFDFFCQPSTENGRQYCNSSYEFTWGWPLINLGEILAVVGFILFFANKAGLSTWLRFSFWYVPITTAFTVWIANTSFSPLGLLNTSATDPVPVIWIFGIVYAIITLAIVIWKRIPSEKVFI